MQSLRDKLVKAGAVSKKDARKAKTETRKQRKKGRQGEAEAAEAQRRQREAFEAKRAAEAEEARARAAAVQAEREASERDARLRQLTERHCLPKIRGQDAVFYFVGPDRRVQRFHSRFDVIEELQQGKLGIVSAPFDDHRGFRVVRREGLEKLAEEAPERILFWNAPGSPKERPAYGATGPATDR
jgi:uncharacterized protein YaiL (DUF2058 family)